MLNSLKLYIPQIFLTLSSTVLLLLVFTATCVKSAQEADHKSLEKIRLQLKWRHQFQFAGYYAAIEKGYFRDEGLEVELIEGWPGINSIEEILSKNADFTIDSPAALIQYQQGSPIVAIAAIFQHSPAVLITQSDKNLNTPQSLKGKSVMITPDIDTENLAMLIDAGVSLEDIHVTPHNWGVEDLIAGKVDAQVAYLTNEPYLFQKAGVEITTINPLDYGIDFYGDCIIATEQFVKSNYERTESFRHAVKKGWAYAMEHPLELAKIIRNKYSDNIELDQLIFEAEAMRPLIQNEFVEIGHMNPARWQHIADTFVRFGMLDANYDLKGFLYNDIHYHIFTEKRLRINFLLISLVVICLISGIIWLTLIVFNRRLASLVQLRTASLATSEQNFRAFFEMASVGVAQVEVQTGLIKRANKKYADIVGYSIDELKSLTYEDITHPDDLDYQKIKTRPLINGQLSEFTIEKRYRRKDNTVVWALLSVSPLWTAEQKPESVLVVIRDITARKNAEERLVFATKVFENSIEGIVVTDADGLIMQVNDAFTSITGFTSEEAIGKNPRILKSDKHDKEFYEKMWLQIAEKGQWSGEIWNRRKNGEAYPEWLTISAVKNDKGKITNFVSIFHDITQNVQQKEALKHQAHHDALTGLPNRVLITDRLESALHKLGRSNEMLALLFLDLDNFKHINDAFGHTVGDNLLCELSKRLGNLIRAGDTIARLGGDEFLILLTPVDHINTVSSIAERLIDCLKIPYHHEEIEFFVTASLGITIAPADGDDPVTLIKNADVAMYRAKHLGKNNFQFFAPDMDVQAHRRIGLEMKLRKALENKEFELYYQPLVHSGSGKIVGAEALIRWNSGGKLVSPSEFIPLAEDSGLILPLGEWVLSSAARQAKAWQDAGYGLTVSVNISSRQFSGQDLFTILQGLLTETGVAPGSLYLEVTESMVMGDLAYAQRTMGALRQLGLKFYLDDFGTGYSSLAYLKKLPIDGLKIDRSFVADIEGDPDSEAIAAVITSLANTLNLQIVAEGVETVKQWTMLHGMSEMLIQGFLVSRAIPAVDFESLIKQGNIEWEKM